MVIALLTLTFTALLDGDRDLSPAAKPTVSEAVSEASDSTAPAAEVATQQEQSDQQRTRFPAATSAKNKIPPQARARLFLMLGMLIAVGVGLLAFVWLLGQATRRYLKKPASLSPPNKMDPDDWASKPIVPRELED